jgi:hypothetical protein
MKEKIYILDDIGIGILDVYSQEDLEKCYNSIPDEFRPDVLVASATNNKMVNENYRKYGDVPFATLRNWLISQFRLKGYKYYFLINSNQIVEDPKIFFKTIQLAETFGTWFIVGNGNNATELEDEDSGLTLNVSPDLNTDFVFTFSGIIKNNGYFDERYFNTKNLDVLDYIIRLRTKGVYPPNHFNPTVGKGIKTSKSFLEKINFKDMPDRDRSVGLSYGYFMHQHKYIPTQNDPPAVSQEELLKSLDTIQQRYAKK